MLVGAAFLVGTAAFLVWNGLELEHVVFAGMLLALAAFLGVLSSFSKTRADTLSIDESGATLVYPSNRSRVFPWSDPNLRLEFMDFTVAGGFPGAGDRNVRFSMSFVEYSFIPPAALDYIESHAVAWHLRVSREPQRFPAPPGYYTVTVSSVG